MTPIALERQHVWVGPDATSFDEPCELCLAAGEVHEEACFVHGTLRRGVGFTACSRGHRIVVRRIGRRLFRLA